LAPSKRFQAGSARTGEIGGGVVGSLAGLSMRGTDSASVTKAIGRFSLSD